MLSKPNFLFLLNFTPGIMRLEALSLELLEDQSQRLPRPKQQKKLQNINAKTLPCLLGKSGTDFQQKECVIMTQCPALVQLTGKTLRLHSTVEMLFWQCSLLSENDTGLFWLFAWLFFPRCKIHMQQSVQFSSKFASTESNRNTL